MHRVTFVYTQICMYKVTLRPPCLKTLLVFKNSQLGELFVVVGMLSEVSLWR